MLQCLREHSSEQPFLGLNAGTLGFLMNDIHQKSAIEDIKNRNWNVFSFPMLDFHGTATSGTTFRAHALNDVYLTRMEGRTANLRIDIDDICIVEKLICDGVIIATSSGKYRILFFCRRKSITSSVCKPSMSPPSVPTHLDCVPSSSHKKQRYRSQHSILIADPFKQLETVFPMEKRNLYMSRVLHSKPISLLKSHNFTETMVRKVLRS